MDSIAVAEPGEKAADKPFGFCVGAMDAPHPIRRPAVREIAVNL